MELQGKIIAVLPERSGVSARGEWKAQSFVIETHDQYPKKMVFDVFGAERLASFAIKAGEELSVSFDISAAQAGAPTPAAEPAPAGGATAPFPPAPEAAGEGSADDLPF